MMRTRMFLSMCLTTGLLFTTAAARLSAQETKPVNQERQQGREFDVSPIVKSDIKPTTVVAEALLKLIKNMVNPASWHDQGGTGTIALKDDGKAIVVFNCDEVVKEVAELLKALEALNAQKVTVEVQEISTNTITAEGLLKVVRAETRDAAGVVVLSDDQTKMLLTAVQSDPAYKRLTMPSLTLSCRVVSTTRAGYENTYVTHMTMVKVGEEKIMLPQSETIFTGVSLKMKADFDSADEQTKLELDYNSNSVNPTVSLYPITTFVTPEFEGGSKGVPIPFTQFIQQPKFEKLAVSKTLTLNADQTVAIPVGTRTRYSDASPRAFSKLPYLNRLFKQRTESTEHVMLLVTLKK